MTCLQKAIQNYKQARENFLTEIFIVFPQIHTFDLHNFGGITVICDINKSDDFPSDYDDLTELKDDLEDEDSDFKSWLVEHNLTHEDIINLATAFLCFPLEKAEEEFRFERKSFIKT